MSGCEHVRQSLWSAFNIRSDVTRHHVASVHDLLFSGFEAIVFAAVRWLFGKEVHRAEAAKSTDNAKATGKAEGKGEASAAAIRQTPTASANEGVTVGPARDLRALADELFPGSP